MSVSDSQPQAKATRPVCAKKKRFPKVPVTTAPLQPLSLTPQQKLMGQLLPASVLNQLAQQHNAYDERRRKVTCVVFFWMALLAFGPGGLVTLHQLITYVLVAQLVAGASLTCASLSKEAVSENLRERPWQFFAAILTYLLLTYADLWRQLAGQPQPVVVEQLQVWLVDATTMRVTQRLLQLFPARATGKRKEWAALKLHLGLRLFHSVPEVLAITPEKQNERKTGFLRPPGEAVLYIFDLGYWAYKLFDTIIDHGQHFLSRLRQDCNPLVLAVTLGDPHWIGQRLKSIQLTGQQVDLTVHLSSDNSAQPQMRHDVRLVGQWIERDSEWHLYVTSLLDSARYSASVLMDLYRLRWQIEILFRNLKCVLRIANFVSTTDNGIRIQIYAALIHYVLTHLVILKAMHLTGRTYEDFSLPYCLEGVQEVLRQTRTLVMQGVSPDWQTLEAQLLLVVITKGLRPNRKRTRLISQVKVQLQTLAASARSP